MIMNLGDEKVFGTRGISDGKIGFCESRPLPGLSQGAGFDDPTRIELNGA